MSHPEQFIRSSALHIATIPDSNFRIAFLKETSLIPDEYYPDLMSVSSETIIEILNDFGYTVPDYMRRLTWHDDYSVNAKYISQNVFAEIEDIYKSRAGFVIREDEFIIELNNDDSNRRKDWISVLPSELEAHEMPGRDACRIAMKKSELEKFLGHKLKRPLTLRRR